VEIQLSWNRPEGLCLDVEDDEYISRGNKMSSGYYRIQEKWR
jgi:hypothetical protein